MASSESDYNSDSSNSSLPPSPSSPSGNGGLNNEQSLKSRILSYPFDVTMHLSESLQLIEWDFYVEQYGKQLICFLNLVFVCCSFYLDCYYEESLHQKYNYINTDNNEVFAKYGIPKRQKSPPYILVPISLVYYGLIVLSFANAVLCLTNVKNYDLINRDISKVPNTPSAYKIDFQKPLIVVDQNEDSFFIKRFSIMIIKLIFYRIFPKEQENVNDTNTSIWRLSMWAPSLLQLYLLSLFSPLNVLFLTLNKPITFNGLVFLVLLMSFQYMLIFNKYEVLIKDKELVFKEFLQDYQENYLNPRLSKKFRDASVDATRSKFANNTVKFYLNDKRTKVY
ncbi:hypothetical protein PACTADRAFT_31936 [Pachysolen tannophilus NRRL Y-2460]|uniref:Nuclear rim protein 1 n=1 Tax=Pachysolen tannophilus NRRL Y-2460 TaxID=669874 RepID=A0A1E4U3G4_PACTA|nr:hypothetical protein PACTADRAFT_31936 [Pachysolen tannophilus NRRL Y-2460]